jgi:hypothetical protein
MVMPDFVRPSYAATVVTSEFEIVGQIEPIGPWLDYLNAKDKYTLPVKNARFLAIGAAAGSAPEKPQVFVNRADICFIYLPDRSSHQTVNMLRNIQAAIAHIGPLICRAEFHMGMDANLLTFMDDLPGNFFPITNADLHAKVALPVPLPNKVELLLVNRLHVPVYHPA